MASYSEHHSEPRPSPVQWQDQVSQIGESVSWLSPPLLLLSMSSKKSFHCLSGLAAAFFLSTTRGSASENLCTDDTVMSEAGPKRQFQRLGRRRWRLRPGQCPATAKRVPCGLCTSLRSLVSVSVFSSARFHYFLHMFSMHFHPSALMKKDTLRVDEHGQHHKNKAGYTAQDAPSMRTFHLRK